MVNTKVIVIVALIVIGALVFATTNRKDEGIKASSRDFVSKEELSLTADMIIDELEAEADEALPSDLKPNIKALSLTDEEEAEFFAILNSVANVVRVSNALGASVPPKVTGKVTAAARGKKRSRLEHQIRVLKKSIGQYRKKVARVKNKQVKSILEARLKKKISSLKHIESQRLALVTKSKASQPARQKTRSEDKKGLLAKLIDQKRELARNTARLVAKEKKLNRLARSKLSFKQKTILAKKNAKTKKALASVRRSAALIKKKIADETKRLKTELVEKKAREKEALALRELEEKEEEAARVSADLAKKAEERGQKALAMKRREVASKEKALAKRLRDEHVAKVNRARLAYNKALAKKKVDTIRVKAIGLKKRALREGQKSDDFASGKKVEKLRREAEKADRNAAEAKRVSDEEIAKNRALNASDIKQKKLAHEKLQKDNLALEKEQLVLERKNAVESIKANRIVSKFATAVSAKQLAVVQKSAVREKAESVVRKRMEKAHQNNSGEIEEGIEKITGMKAPDALGRLRTLDVNILFELRVFLQASGGHPHPLLPVISKLIDSKSESVSEKLPDAERLKTIRTITGLDPTEYNQQSLARKDILVIERLRDYAESVGDGMLLDDANSAIFMNQLEKIGNEVNLDFSGRGLVNADYEAIHIVDLDKLISFFVQLPEPRHPVVPQLVVKLQHIRQEKKHGILAETDALVEARSQKKNRDLVAIDTARATGVVEKMEKVSVKLDTESSRLDAEILQIGQLVSKEKKKLLVDQEIDLAFIEREHDKEKTLIVQELSAELEDIEKELFGEARDKAVISDTTTERKLRLLQEKHADARNRQRVEANKAISDIETKIESATATTRRDLLEKLSEEKETRRIVATETEKARVDEKKTVVEESAATKKRLKESFDTRLAEEKVVAEEALLSRLETVKLQQQDLVQKIADVQSLQVDQLDLEGRARIEELEREKRVVDEDKFLVETPADLDNAVHPRSSKKGLVDVSRKKNGNGSAFAFMKVPSDLSPGEHDRVPVFVSKEAVNVLDQYKDVFRKIERESSLANVSAGEKKVIAMAGAEFRNLRRQYVEKRQEKVLQRVTRLASQLTLKS